MKDDFLAVLAVWLVLSILLACLAAKMAAIPLLYYDEALSAGMAKDFVENKHRSVPFPGTTTAQWFGRPAPTFIQGYIGALRSWMMIPSFAIFGPTLKALRWTNLAWTLISLLLFMLWAWRLMGRSAAMLAGALLSLDPAYFFVNFYDWGPTAPGMLCRMAGFLLLLLWWQSRRPAPLFFAGLFWGLGFYAKIDFVLILAGAGLALGLTHANRIREALRTDWRQLTVGLLGFLIGASPALLRLPQTIQSILSGGAAGDADETMEKLHTAWTMFDGSYFYRLMTHGGDFKKMFDGSAGVWSPFGLVFAIALALLAMQVIRGWRRKIPEPLPAFLLLSATLLLLETWLLPSAIRLHHWTLAYPFPHLIITLAALRLWDRPANTPFGRRAIRGAVALALVGVLMGHLLAITKTSRLIQETGGRGWWSSALSTFAGEFKHRSDLTIVSLDWGFNEQLRFFTDGPRLSEPIWQLQKGARFSVSRSSNIVYLVHPPESTLLPYGRELLAMAYSANPRQVSIQSYLDRQGDTAFLAIRFLEE